MFLLLRLTTNSHLFLDILFWLHALTRKKCETSQKQEHNAPLTACNRVFITFCCF